MWCLVTLSRSLRTKEEVVKDFRTGEILDAARRVIADLGYAEASMERIAQNAGVAKGTLYLYFKNKETLLARAFEDDLSEFMSRAQEATRRARGPTEKLREVVRMALEHAAQNHAFFQAIRELSPLGSDASTLYSDTLLEQVESYLDFVASVIERGIRAGKFRKLDSLRAARFLTELVRGATIARLSEPHPPPVEEDVETTLDFFLHGVGAGDRR